jgi:NADPH2:quinone reductase
MSQTALLVTKIGAPLTKSQRPKPHPKQNQVVVKVTVAGLNPHDQKARDTGLFIADDLPAVLANDVAGIVTEIGPGVSNRKIGDRIVGHASLEPGSLQRGLQEYAVLDVPYTLKIPEETSEDQAATLPTNVIAPLVALFSESTLGMPAPWTERAKTFDYNAQTVLIVGGGSACGKFAVQLAKLAGIGRIVVVGSEKSEKELRKYGATDVIMRDNEDVLGQIRSIVGDELIYAIDCVNRAEGQILAVNALSNEKKGTLVRLVRGNIDGSKVHEKKNGYEVKNVLGLSHVHADLCTPFWERVPGYLQKGKIIPLAFQVVEGLDAETINQLLDEHRDGKAVLKVHVHPQSKYSLL